MHFPNTAVILFICNFLKLFEINIASCQKAAKCQVNGCDKTCFQKFAYCPGNCDNAFIVPNVLLFIKHDFAAINIL